MERGEREEEGERWSTGGGDENGLRLMILPSIEEILSTASTASSSPFFPLTMASFCFFSLLFLCLLLLQVEFSGEEVHGKFVDLVMLHERALNLKACFPDAPDYSTYVSTFASSLEHVPSSAKMSGEWRKKKKWKKKKLEGYNEHP